MFSSEVLGFRFGFDPFTGLLGDPGGIGPLLAVRLLFDAVDATDSASEPRLPFDLFFAIEYRIVCYLLSAEIEVDRTIGAAGRRRGRGLGGKGFRHKKNNTHTKNSNTSGLGDGRFHLHREEASK